jgi:hypothetical protein
MERRVDSFPRFQLRDICIAHAYSLGQRPLTQTQFGAPLLDHARQSSRHSTNLQYGFMLSYSKEPPQ